MKINSLEEAKKIVYGEIGTNLLDPNRPIIIDEYTLDFEWGYVFYYNGKKFVENPSDSSNCYLGNMPILVDKNDGTVHSIKSIFETLDTKLEAYRVLKGYPHVIKFPIKTSFEGKTLLEKVRLLFRTEEIHQIKQGLQIAEQNNLFDINQFKEIVWSNHDVFERTFEESIAFTFGQDTLCLEEKHIINECFPKDLKIFEDFKKLQISNVKMIYLSEDILKLPKLECIEFWETEIDDITLEIFKLDKLTTIIFNGGFKPPVFGKRAKKILDKLVKDRNVHISD